MNRSFQINVRAFAHFATNVMVLTVSAMMAQLASWRVEMASVLTKRPARTNTPLC